MADLTEDLKRLRTELAEAEHYLRIEEIRARLPQLETEMGRPDLWDDAERARSTQTEFTAIREDLALYDRMATGIDDAETLWELSREEDDLPLEAEAVELIESLGEEFSELELRALFTGQYDEGDAVCEIHSGAGGTDSQDWAEMLFFMYRKWAQSEGFDIEVSSSQQGQEAGITSAEFVIRGRYAYGLLQAERGVHRLVRISPFDSQARRHTAFASFSVVPYIEDATDQIDIDEKDLRVDVFRSSGAGGQHVNTTDSAVRVTHLPTGVVVSCQNERSQHQNKERCMQMLAMKLVDLERQKREDMLADEAGESKKVEWGSQIRSYVLQPYQQVKDERSGETSGNPEGVLDGAVGPFMEAWLRWRRAGPATS
ncbi:MAG: peptide chain release factor 2 [Actinomycetia bacterium]|nr:peptide chain release factor 2 [Actinomycetes bacterium]MCP4224218.1 peptide chain release factor 2 [Actinomycetes bacterium]MCP5034814.1 peptide chain release factor 2 [Actinomycetes bacterium]